MDISRGARETSVSQYGAVVLRLSDSVRDRTTITLADSLDHTVHGTLPLVAPTPLAAPTLDGAFTDADILNSPTLADATGYGYVECQIHGGVSLEDIVEVVFTRGTAPDEELGRRLWRRRPRMVNE
jgi:hypothetical protein